MNFTLMVAAILLGQEPELKRENFNLISALPVTNRLVSNKDLRKEVIIKIRELLKAHDGNTEKIKKILVTKKLIDWLYKKSDFSGALSETEKSEIDNIINLEIHPVKEWKTYNFKGQNIQLYSFKDQLTDKDTYLIEDQTPETQKILKEK